MLEKVMLTKVLFLISFVKYWITEDEKPEEDETPGKK